MEADSNFSFHKNGNLLQKKIKMIMCTSWCLCISNPPDSYSRTLENGDAGGIPSFNVYPHPSRFFMFFFPAEWSLLQYFPIISQQSFSSKENVYSVTEHIACFKPPIHFLKTEVWVGDFTWKWLTFYLSFINWAWFPSLHKQFGNYKL